jgi:hypothetical protein
MTKTFKSAETFVMLARKADARRVAKRLRDCNIIVGVRGQRGNNEVFGYVPNGKTASDIRELALKFYRERTSS